MFNPPDDCSHLPKQAKCVLILRDCKTHIFSLMQTELLVIHVGNGAVRVLSGDFWKYISDHKNLNDQDGDQHD